MSLSDTAKEIRRLTQTAGDTERSADVRILAARKLLRVTTHSIRSVRVAKRISKLYMKDQEASAETRKKATSLFQFALDERESDDERYEPAALAEPSISAAFQRAAYSMPQSIEDRNAGWDAVPPAIPKKWIDYEVPADLPAF